MSTYTGQTIALPNYAPEVSVGKMHIESISAHVSRNFYFGGPVVECTARVRDVKGDGELIDLRLTRTLPRDASTGHFKKMIKSALMELLEHELDEWLRIDGELLTAPHPEDIAPPPVVKELKPPKLRQQAPKMSRLDRQRMREDSRRMARRYV